MITIDSIYKIIYRKLIAFKGLKANDKLLIKNVNYFMLLIAKLNKFYIALHLHTIMYNIFLLVKLRLIKRIILITQ